MDFWSRLIAHTLPSTGNSRNWKDFAKDPVRRLQRFEKEYTQLIQAWRLSPSIAHDDEAAERIEICLQELTNMLTDENRRPLPHPCITFCATKQIYIPIAKISTTSNNEWVIKEAVLFFATLIESEEEAFVENDHFSASLTHLMVRITGANALRLSADTEARVVELAFNITTKLRLDPDILPAWFKSQPQNGEEKQPLGEHERFTGRTQKQDFPLFYLLMDYIHHEGKVGDFARTGLLYIIEAASSSVELEQWIVESDLSTLMATGLGALYSQLSRKLVIDHPSNALPAILALSDYEHPKPNYEVISSCTFEFQSHLETFLSHLLFWQDVLNHCRSVEVKSSLLEHFQVIFLQQLLYPSLLESSDIDGGSSVAVLTYLRHILQSVDHPDMINLILHYLLGLPDIVGSVSSDSKDGVSAARKRKSMDLATMMASKSEAADPLLFNLVDLILACLRSQSLQTIYVTLQLVSVILKRHHRYAVITLLYTEGVLGNSSFRTTGAHEQEVEYLMGLAQTIGGEDNFNEIYDSVIKDTMIRVENHPCSMKLITPKALASNHKQPAIPDSLPGAPRDVRSHTLHPDDPLLTSVLDRLETFFINPVETNLSLTEVIFDLAICGYMHLEGWFLRHPSNYTYDEDQDAPAAEPPADIDPESPEYDEYQQLLSMHHCRRRPQWSRDSLPRLLRILQTLCDEVAAYRDTIPRFNDLLQQRREAFQTADGASMPPSVAPSVVPSAAPSRSRTPSTLQPPAQLTPGLSTPGNTAPERPTSGLGLESFAQRIFSDLSSTISTSPNRTANNSPRPRSYTTRTVSERSSYFTSNEAPPPLPPRNRTPSMLVTSPRKGTGGFGLGASGSALGGASVPGAVASDISGSGKMELVMSQARAFQAVDQSILARKVGIPDVSDAKHVGPNLDGQSDSKADEEMELGERLAGEGQDVPVLPRLTVHRPPPKGEDGGLDALEGDEDDEEAKPAVPPKDDPPSPASAVGTDTPLEAGEAPTSSEINDETTDSEGQDPPTVTADGHNPDQLPKKAEDQQEQQASQEAAEAADKEEEEEEEATKASVSHVLTNVIILQSFLFELASLVQVRAGVFEEVRFV
ncbi:hypothetical protein GE21DRAFT_1099804 [Neurospora crassa]|uniref:FHF complex subunit HOOK-interacting protein C-terminal domain-containing protein n=2 Tax=Neurospora crassa TaxID=5141 RepID=Q7S795_NEUCR|nr:hypothetical protein NCU08869 [Neurospora crassa OR74A]EAA31426.2 hypothetical protein NCU08869 [Neurospora crassa OR74A]KHE84134.1 hypothetical protein GE21DRAFT_1099804 [Neurospora crassa]CAD21248.1 conserved hypothetical protein [Neurospora crassa]|eukprot:XP_960662.2 hypothetical protein NCU08869 [Neurospora crassa OR74A]